MHLAIVAIIQDLNFKHGTKNNSSNRALQPREFGTVEEFLSRLRLGTFLLDTYNANRLLSMGGYGENGFLALNIPKLPPIGTKFWPHVEGMRRVDCDFFASEKFP